MERCAKRWTGEWVGWTLALSIAQAAPAPAAKPAVPPPEEIVTYVTATWKQAQGLPGDWVECILRTRDGFLWLGNPTGLTRFDGSSFVRFNRENCPAFLSEVCKALAEDLEGNLWVATKKGLLRFGAEGVQRYLQADGLGGDETTSLCASRDGGIWIGTSGGVSLYRQGRLSHYPLPEQGSPFIYGVLEDSHGRIWVGREGGCYQFDPQAGRYSPVWQTPWPPPVPEAGVARCLMEDHTGAIWFGTDHTVFTWREGALSEIHLGKSSPTHRVKCLLADREGEIWAVIGFVLHRLHGDHFEPMDARLGLTDATVNCIYQDRNGNYWIGSRYGGLTRARLSPFRVFTQKDGLPHNSVRSVSPSRPGGVWLATAGGAGRLTAGGFDPLTPNPLFARDGLSCMVEDQDGGVWLATAEHGVSVHLGGKWWEVSPGISKCRVFLVDRANNVWAGALKGLMKAPSASGSFRFGDWKWWIEGQRPGQWNVGPGIVAINAGTNGTSILANSLWSGDQAPRQLLPSELGPLGLAWLNEVAPTNEPASYDIRALAEDRDGSLWLGTADGGLQRLRNRCFTTLRAKDGLASDSIAALCVEGEGTLWVGTAKGLSRVKDHRAVSLAKAGGALAASIDTLVEDNLGFLWIVTETVIARFNIPELNDCAEGRSLAPQYVTFDESDGLLSTAPNGGGQPAACKSADGRLWFATTHGLVEFDPTRVRPNPPPARVVIEEVRAAGFVAADANRWLAPKPLAVALPRSRPSAEQPPSATSHFSAPAPAALGKPRTSPGSELLRLPPGSGRQLEIHYTALSLRAPETISFAYQLEGEDKGWQEAGPRRVAYYNNLRPGHYRFRVRATDSLHPTTQSYATLAFYVAPHIYETWYFYLFSGLTLLGATYGGHRRRLRRQARQQREDAELQRERSLNQERLRIARDIHDDLGAGLHQIGLLTELARLHRQRHGPALEDLAQISTAARDLRDSLDEIVWAVNPANDTLPSLLAHLRQYVAEYLELANLEAQLDWSSQVPPWPLSARTRHDLFLVVKEALRNIAQHAAATHVAMRVQIESSILRLTIQDDGRGFNADPLPLAPRRGEGQGEGSVHSTFGGSQTERGKPRPAATTGLDGNGLTNMRARIAGLGGVFSLESCPGQGTRIDLTLPLNTGNSNASHDHT